MNTLQQQFGAIQVALTDWVKQMQQPHAQQQPPSLVVGLLIGTIRRVELEKSLMATNLKMQQDKIQFLELNAKDRVIRPVYEAKVKRLEAVSAELAEAKSRIAALERELSLLQMTSVS
jgi:hypothetical protein